jgi:hypothetical protein
MEVDVFGTGCVVDVVVEAPVTGTCVVVSIVLVAAVVADTLVVVPCWPASDVEPLFSITARPTTSPVDAVTATTTVTTRAALLVLHSPTNFRPIAGNVTRTTT